MSKYFCVYPNQKSQNTAKHLREVMSAIAALRGNVASIRQTIGLTRIMCEDAGLDNFTGSLDAFDKQMRDGMDDLSKAIASTTVSITDVSASVQKAEATTGTLTALLGKDTPPAGDGASAPAPAVKAGGLKGLLGKMKPDSGDAAGGSLSGPDESN